MERFTTHSRGVLARWCRTSRPSHNVHVHPDNYSSDVDNLQTRSSHSRMLWIRVAIQP